MENSNSDLLVLCQRVEKLEQRNRRMRLFCTALIVTSVLTLIGCMSRATSVVEAQRFVLRDKNGKVRVEVGMDGEYPVIRLLDADGKALTTIGAGTLGISSDKGSATLLADTLQFSKKGVGLVSATLQDGTLYLFGKNGTVMLDSNAPVLEISDSNGFRADLGQNNLTTDLTGAKESTSAATLVLANKKGKILWRTP